MNSINTREILFLIDPSLFDTEIFIENHKLEILKPASSCDSNSTKTVLDTKDDFLNTNKKVTIYLSGSWIRIENMHTGKSTPKIYYDKNILNVFESDCETNSTSHEYIYIGLNRLLNESYGFGSGLCSANVSFLSCYSDEDGDMNVNVDHMTYNLKDNETIQWIHELDFFQPGLENLACSGEGVLKVKFDPNGVRKVARFDMKFGDIVSGFTFNIGDSPTNNGYGNFKFNFYY
jgi:hypothetical protein